MQLDLDLEPPRRPRARRTDPGTSHKRLELADILPWSRVSISPLLKPMEEAGWVCRTNETRNGGIVWRSKK